MTGGKAGIIAKVETLRPYSSKPLYSPVPYDFLHVASAKPGLALKVNKIPALCKDDCTYQFDATKTPTVTSYSRSSETVTI